MGKLKNSHDHVTKIIVTIFILNSRRPTVQLRPNLYSGGILKSRIQLLLITHFHLLQAVKFKPAMKSDGSYGLIMYGYYLLLYVHLLPGISRHLLIRNHWYEAYSDL